MGKIWKKFTWKQRVALFFVCLTAFLFLPNTGPFSQISIHTMTNDYFNSAKSILQGQVLYTDIYDHKGLYTFLLCFIPVWISDTSYIGVFLMEGMISIGMILSCMIFCRTRYNFKQSIIVNYLIILVMYMVFPSIKINTEPLCIILWFLLMAYIDRGIYKNYSKLHYFFFGIAFGIIFWMKYPMVIIMFPAWLYILIQSVKRKEAKYFIHSCVFSVIGAILISIPVLTYHAIHNNIKEIMEVYFRSVNFSLSYYSNGNIYEYASYLLLIFGFIGCIIKWIRGRRRDAFFYVWIVIIFYLTNNNGVRAYSALFLTMLIPMFMSAYIKKFPTKIVGVLILASVCFLGVPLLNPSLMSGYDTVKTLADKWNITNQNIIYICEDMGLGSYSPEPYAKKHQWHPARIMWETDKEEYERVLNYIASEEFEFLVIKAEDYEHKIDWKIIEKDNCFANIVSMLQKHYEPIESFVYDNGGVEVYYLCRSVSSILP